MWVGAVLLMILFCSGVILLAVWGVKLLSRDRPFAPATPEKSAWEIAQLRYSRGELSRDEYLALMNDLKQSEETTKRIRN